MLPYFRFCLPIFLALLALGGAGCGRKDSGAITDPLVLTPAMALTDLKAHTLFYNAVARPWLLEKRPDLVPAEERAQPTPRVREMAQAVQNPKLFRQLDRQGRFDALLLTGDPSQYRPLLDHLLDAQDWKLTYLDHTSLIFRRDAGGMDAGGAGAGTGEALGPAEEGAGARAGADRRQAGGDPAAGGGEGVARSGGKAERQRCRNSGARGRSTAWRRATGRGRWRRQIAP